MGFFHVFSMVFDGFPWFFHGFSIKNPWLSMVFPWFLMVFPGFFHGVFPLFATFFATSNHRRLGLALAPAFQQLLGALELLKGGAHGHRGVEQVLTSTTIIIESYNPNIYIYI